MTNNTGTQRIGKAPKAVHEEANYQAAVIFGKTLRELSEDDINTCYDIAWTNYRDEGF